MGSAVFPSRLPPPHHLHGVLDECEYRIRWRYLLDRGAQWIHTHSYVHLLLCEYAFEGYLVEEVSYDDAVRSIPRYEWSSNLFVVCGLSDFPQEGHPDLPILHHYAVRSLYEILPR